MSENTAREDQYVESMRLLDSFVLGVKRILCAQNREITRLEELNAQLSAKLEDSNRVSEMQTRIAKESVGI